VSTGALVLGRNADVNLTQEATLVALTTLTQTVQSGTAEGSGPAAGSAEAAPAAVEVSLPPTNLEAYDVGLAESRAKLSAGGLFRRSKVGFEQGRSALTPLPTLEVEVGEPTPPWPFADGFAEPGSMLKARIPLIERIQELAPPAGQTGAAAPQNTDTAPAAGTNVTEQPQPPAAEEE
jgi:hypothetical protein